MELSLSRDTWLDLTVNIVPIAILFLLDVMFLLVNPWGWNLWLVFWMHALTLFPLVVLSIVTYVSGWVIQRDERRVSEG